MEQREVELQHQHGAAVLQQQQIPISRHLTPNPPNPQHQQPTETHVKQQALSLGGGEGEKERGNHKSYPQPHPHPHPQQLPSAIIPPTAPEVIFERPVVNTAPKISTTHQSAEKLQLDQMLAGNAEDDARRKRAQEAADEAFARQMQEEERKRPLWSTAAPAKEFAHFYLVLLISFLTKRARNAGLVPF